MYNFFYYFFFSPSFTLVQRETKHIFHMIMNNEYQHNQILTEYYNYLPILKMVLVYICGLDHFLDLIVQQVVLARELGLLYAAVAMATDYDCWREGEEVVSVEKVLKTFKLV